MLIFTKPAKDDKLCRKHPGLSAKDRRERLKLEHTRLPVKLNDCNSQRLLEKPDLDEEEVHHLELMETKKYLELGPQISELDERGEI